MKKVLFVFLLFAGIITIATFYGCINGGGTPEPPKTDTVVKVIRDTIYPQPTVDTPTPEPEADQMPTKKAFYGEMLEYFCRLYYKEAFDWDYLEKTILVERVVPVDSANEVQISGRHDYDKKWHKKGEGQPFKATVIREGKDEYEITFERKYKDKWENVVHTITYP